MDNYKDVTEKNLVEMKAKEEKTMKILLFVTVSAILLLVSWLAGTTIGKDLGEFVYNVTH